MSAYSKLVRFNYIIIYCSLFFLAGLSGNCQNISNDSVKSVYATSDFVFIGKLTGFDEYNPGKGNEKILRADFDVIEIYKGRRWNRVLVITNQKDLEAHKEYLIYGTWGEAKNKKGKKVKAGFFNCQRIVDAEKDKALSDIVIIVKILKKKLFGRIKSPRAKIILRKCSCSTEHL